MASPSREAACNASSSSASLGVTSGRGARSSPSVLITYQVGENATASKPASAAARSDAWMRSRLRALATHEVTLTPTCTPAPIRPCSEFRWLNPRLAYPAACRRIGSRNLGE